jgi:hypothetical protein
MSIDDPVGRVVRTSEDPLFALPVPFCDVVCSGLQLMNAAAATSMKLERMTA